MPPPLLPLVAAVAVADVCGERAQIKWPNDVLIDGRKVAGILVEGRPQERWAVLGIGLNVAVTSPRLPDELRDRATSLGRAPSELDRTIADLLGALEARLAADPAATLEAWRARDALKGRPVRWAGGHRHGSRRRR